MGTRRINDGFKWQMQREVLNDVMTRCFNGAGLASGAISTKVYNANPLVYCIDGYLYSVAASGILGVIALPQGAGYSTCCIEQGPYVCSVLKLCLQCVLLWWFRCLCGRYCLHRQCRHPGISVSDSADPYFHGIDIRALQSGPMAFESASVTSATIRYFNISMIPQGVIISE